MRLSLTAIVALAVGISAADANTLRMAASTDVSSMDPHSMTESNTIAFLNHIYEGLVRYNDQLKIEPALAESWEVVEPPRVRFHLREGVTFHDGSPFTADDVVASVMRAIHPDSPIKSNLPSVEVAEKVDDHTVDLVLTGTDRIGGAAAARHADGRARRLPRGRGAPAVAGSSAARRGHPRI